MKSILENVSDREFYIYLKAYIDKITANLSNFFIAISDIEYDLLEKIKNEDFDNYEVALVDRNNYYSAVVLRNDININKIVVLSSDSIKRIDSLKDFNEYPVIPEDNNFFWDIISETFGVCIDSKEKKFLNLLMDKKRVSLSVLFNYIRQCNENGMLNHKKMQQNLNIFNCWKTKEDNLNLVDLKKVILSSEPNEIDKRLLDGILNGKISNISKNKKNKILNLLISNNYEPLFEMLYFEDVKEIFKKTNSRKLSTKIVDENVEYAEQYLYSYEYLVNVGFDNIENIEKAIEADDEDDDINIHFKEILQKFNNDVHIEEVIERSDKYFQEIIYQAQLLNLSKAKKTEFIDLLECFINEAKYVINLYPRVTPIVLLSFCNQTKKYCNLYFQILTLILTDEDISEACGGSPLIETLQVIFCIKTENNYIMTYMHPVAIFYFNCIKELFEHSYTLISSNCSELKKSIILGILKQEKVKFPIKFMLFNGSIYSYDYSMTCYPIKFNFQVLSDLANNSLMDFRIITKDIFRYVNENRFLPEMNVSIVGISDLSGIMLLIKKLQNKRQSKDFLLNRININIVSSNEKRLKDQIESWIEKITDNNFIQFKFTYNKYCGDSKIQLTNIIDDSDLVYLADTGVIYKKERLVRYLESPNSMTSDILNFNFENQVNNYIKGDSSAINVLWESLHNVLLNNDNNLAEWKNKNIDNNVLVDINLAIKKNNILSVVILSSNTNLINSIHLTEAYTAQIDKSVDKDILILEFSSKAFRRILINTDDFIVRVPIRPFLESIIDIDELDDLLKNLDWNEKIIDNIYIKIELENEEIKTSCIVGVKETYSDENGIDSEQCKEYVKDILDIAFIDNMPLSKKFKEIFINEMYQNSESYAAGLLTYYMSRIYKPVQFDINDITEQHIVRINTDSVNIIEFQNVITFFEKYPVIDESASYTFKRSHSLNMLSTIIQQNNLVNLLPLQMVSNMKTLYNFLCEDVK